MIRVYATTLVRFQKPNRTFETGRIELTKAGGSALQEAVHAQVRTMAQKMSTSFFSTLGNADVTQPLLEVDEPVAAAKTAKRVKSKPKTAK